MKKRAAGSSRVNRPKRGRKALPPQERGARYNVYLRPKTVARAKQLGKNSLSLGITRACELIDLGPVTLRQALRLGNGSLSKGIRCAVQHMTRQTVR